MISFLYWSTTLHLVRRRYKHYNENSKESARPQSSIRGRRRRGRARVRHHVRTGRRRRSLSRGRPVVDEGVAGGARHVGVAGRMAAGYDSAACCHQAKAKLARSMGGPMPALHVACEAHPTATLSRGRPSLVACCSLPSSSLLAPHCPFPFVPISWGLAFTLESSLTKFQPKGKGLWEEKGNS